MLSDSAMARTFFMAVTGAPAGGNEQHPKNSSGIPIARIRFDNRNDSIVPRLDHGIMTAAPSIASPFTAARASFAWSSEKVVTFGLS